MLADAVCVTARNAWCSVFTASTRGIFNA